MPKGVYIHTKHYNLGKKFCSKCKTWFKTKELRCPFCNKQLRQNMRSGNRLKYRRVQRF